MHTGEGWDHPTPFRNCARKDFEVTVINQSVESFRREQVKKATSTSKKSKRKAARTALELQDAKRRLRYRLLESIKAKSDNEVAADIRVATDDFLLSPAWRAVRRLALDKHGSSCLKCGHMGTKKSPINVDHIKPRKFFPELALDVNNLQPLCGACNKAKGNSIADYRRERIAA